jgi:hypothetical protein
MGTVAGTSEPDYLNRPLKFGSSGPGRRSFTEAAGLGTAGAEQREGTFFQWRRGPTPQRELTLTPRDCAAWLQALPPSSGKEMISYGPKRGPGARDMGSEGILRESPAPEHTGLMRVNSDSCSAWRSCSTTTSRAAVSVRSHDGTTGRRVGSI